MCDINGARRGNYFGGETVVTTEDEIREGKLMTGNWKRRR